ncbi:hypothetical protein CBFG_03365 [Clostridiales bacterium 1_7_47FAA]|nr:hypothetical protein CBFG_03365 [Clostridiales bacterium 1_7_47FAA]
MHQTRTLAKNLPETFIKVLQESYLMEQKCRPIITKQVIGRHFHAYAFHSKVTPCPASMAL